MRDGRRKRLGLAEGTEGTVQDAYLDRILSNEDVAGETNILNIDPDANVRTTDNRYVQDAYNYFLGGGFPQEEEPVIDTPIVDTTPVVDTSGEGQATSGLDTTQPFQDLVDPNVNIDEFANEDTTMPSNLTSDMVGNIDTTPVDTYTSATGNVAPDGTTMAGVGGYLDGIDLDNTFAGTPVNTPSGNNPFGYEDLNPSALAGLGINETSGLDDIGQDIGEEFDDTPVSTPSGNNSFGYEDLNPSLLANPAIANASGLGDIGADIGIDDTVDYGMPQGSPGQLNPAAPSIEDITTDFSPPNIGEISGPATMTVDELAASSADQGLEAFDPSAVSQAFTAGKQAIASGISTVAEVGQSIANTIGGVYNGVDQTVSVFDKEINVPATLAGIALNQVVGAPISLAFGALKAIGGMLPTGVSSIEYDSYNDSQKGAIDEAYGPGGVMDGYNVESAFGKGAKATVQERLENRTSNGVFDSTTDKLNELSAKLGGITVTAPAYDFDDTTTTTTTPAGNTVDVETGDITNEVGVSIGNINNEFGDGVATAQAAADVAASNAASVSLGDARYGDGGPGYEGPTGGFGGYEQGAFADDATGSDTSPGATGGEGGFDDDSSSDANTGFDTSPGATGGEGGGGNGGGGKGIVCTMMNDFYGFGSFRNKIWLEHSKSLAPEYQKGYHKIFLPLVAYARKNGVTNKIVRKTLEHIAVHRTIDIRQESRGKTHLLGRVYRKILEPICYLVGKYAK